jgi:predicted protein tyrosine phosphatase
MEIIVLDMYETLELVRRYPNTYRVVSIVGASPHLRLAPTPFSIPGAKEVLYFEFDDIERKDYISFPELRLATLEECQRALDFLKKGGPCIVHCEAGVSRSGAIALGYLLSESSQYQQAVDRLFAIRPSADPNSYIVYLMCQLLGREHEYAEILKYLKCATRGSQYRYATPHSYITPYFPKEK